MFRKIIITTLFTVLIGLLLFTAKNAFRYIHWKTKSQGYPGLYEQTDEYSFTPVRVGLAETNWNVLAEDSNGDGELPNWPDAKSLSYIKSNDTLWFKAVLHNYLNLNEPVSSIAISGTEGQDWYGTVDDFYYESMISVGYRREGAAYFGYNFIDDQKGVCSFHYDLTNNSLFLGLPLKYLDQFKEKQFVFSVGQKGYWNDDFDQVLSLESILRP